jgi:hypothetical protein
MAGSQLRHFIKPVLIHPKGHEIEGDEEDLHLPLVREEDIGLGNNMYSA